MMLQVEEDIVTSGVDELMGGCWVLRSISQLLL